MRQFGLAVRSSSALGVGVAVNVLQPGLVHVPMGVFGPVVVRVGVFVLHVVVLVGRVCMCVRHVAVPMLVVVRCVVGVLFAHR